MMINGFIVVRVPEQNYLVRERDLVPYVNGVYYAGVDRELWIDVFDEDYYSKKVPPPIAHLASALKSQEDDFSGISICRDAADALTLLAYSNRNEIRNELVVVRAPALNEAKGTMDTEMQIEWLGFDVVAWGEWSLIAGGIFMNPGHYSAWLPRVNRFGLFNDTTFVADYIVAYEKAVKVGQSEALAPESAGFARFAIEVGKVVFSPT